MTRPLTVLALVILTSCVGQGDVDDPAATDDTTQALARRIDGISDNGLRREGISDNGLTDISISDFGLAGRNDTGAGLGLDNPDNHFATWFWADPVLHAQAMRYFALAACDPDQVLEYAGHRWTGLRGFGRNWCAAILADRRPDPRTAVEEQRLVGAFMLALVNAEGKAMRISILPDGVQPSCLHRLPELMTGGTVWPGLKETRQTYVCTTASTPEMLERITGRMCGLSHCRDVFNHDVGFCDGSLGFPTRLLTYMPVYNPAVGASREGPFQPWRNDLWGVESSVVYGNPATTWTAAYTSAKGSRGRVLYSPPSGVRIRFVFRDVTGTCDLTSRFTVALRYASSGASRLRVAVNGRESTVDFASTGSWSAFDWRNLAGASFGYYKECGGGAACAFVDIEGTGALGPDLELALMYPFEPVVQGR